MRAQRKALYLASGKYIESTDVLYHLNNRDLSPLSSSTSSTVVKSEPDSDLEMINLRNNNKQQPLSYSLNYPLRFRRKLSTLINISSAELAESSSSSSSSTASSSSSLKPVSSCSGSSTTSTLVGSDLINKNNNSNSVLSKITSLDSDSDSNMDYLAGAHTATDVAVDVQFPNLPKNKDEFDYSSSDPSSVGGGDDLKVAAMEHDDLLNYDRRTSSSSPAFESELIRTPPPPESSSLTTATTTTTSLSTPHSSPYSTTHTIPATAITATTTTTATPTSFTDIVSATASPRGKKRNSSGEPICNSNYDTNNITTKTIDTSSIGITTGSSPGPGLGLGLGLGPRSVSVSGSVSGIGPSSSFGSSYGSGLNTNTHRPLGPAHLEHDYTLARTALSRAISQAVYDLYGFSIPVRDASVEARRPSGQGCLQAIRKHPLVRRACVGVDRADRALEDALGRGERWENTGVPDEWRWGSEVLRPFEWAWVPPEVKVGGRGKGGGGGVGKRARMEVDTELIIESRTRGQQKRKAESGLGLSSGSRFGFGFGSGGRLGLGSGGGLGSGDRVDGRRSVDRGVVVDVDHSVVDADVDVDRRNKVRKVSGLGDASSSDLRSTLGVGVGREAEGKSESRFASGSELVRDSIVSGSAVGASSLSLSSTTVISPTTTTTGAVTVTPAIIVIGAPTVTTSTAAPAPVSKHLPPPTSSSSSISSSSSPSSYASLSVSNPGTPVEKRKRGRPRKIPRVEGCSVSAPVPVGSSSLSVTGIGAGGRIGAGSGAGNGNRDVRGTRDTRGVKGVMQPGAAVPMSISASSFYGVPSGMNAGSTLATVANGSSSSASAAGVGVGGATSTSTVPAKRPRGRPRKHFVRIPLESLMTPIIPV